MSQAEVDDALTVLNGKAIGKKRKWPAADYCPWSENAVLHFEIAEFDRFEDRGVVHAQPPVSVLAACQTSASKAGTMLCAGHRFQALAKKAKPGSGRCRRAPFTARSTHDPGASPTRPAPPPSRCPPAPRARA